MKQEQEATKARRRKGKKAGSEDELDLHEEAATEKDAEKDDKKEEKASEAPALKTQTANS